MKGFNGSKPITKETRLKMAEACRRTSNGFKKGHKTNVGMKHTEEAKVKMRLKALASGQRPSQPKGYKHSKETIELMSSIRKLRPNRYWLGKERPNVFTEEVRRRLSDSMKKRVASGKHNFWKGGITPINNKLRGGIEYKLWESRVRDKDNNKCVRCGEKRKSKLVAHHIKNFAQYPELRLIVDNGITFCKECHKEFHIKYGKKDNCFEQVTEFTLLPLHKDVVVYT